MLLLKDDGVLTVNDMIQPVLEVPAQAVGLP
jgi:hypothetical protein